MAGCKRLEKENWRRAHWELQNRFSVMQVDSTLSATARPFQPQAALQSSRENDGPQAYPSRSGWAGSHPTSGLTVGSPVRRMSLSHPHSSDDDGVSSDASNQDRPLRRRRGSRGSWNSQSGSDSDDTRTSRRRQRRRMDFLVRSKSPNLVARKDILMTWPMPLGSGSAVSLTTMIIMRAPTSYPW